MAARRPRDGRDRALPRRLVGRGRARRRAETGAGRQTRRAPRRRAERPGRGGGRVPHGVADTRAAVVGCIGELDVVHDGAHARALPRRADVPPALVRYRRQDHGGHTGSRDRRGARWGRVGARHGRVRPRRPRAATDDAGGARPARGHWARCRYVGREPAGNPVRAGGTGGCAPGRPHARPRSPVGPRRPRPRQRRGVLRLRDRGAAAARRAARRSRRRADRRRPDRCRAAQPGGRDARRCPPDRVRRRPTSVSSPSPISTRPRSPSPPLPASTASDAASRPRD